MAIKTHEDLSTVFNEVCSQVIKAICERSKKLLQEHINVDTYGINKTNTGTPSINEYYLDGTGTPSYEFRDKAWDTKIEETLFYLFYNGSNMTPPSQSSPYQHGNYYKGEDRRAILAELLNVIGESSGDFPTEKARDPFWDNFEDELKDKLGHWLYTEFNNRGLKIESLKNARF